MHSIIYPTTNLKATEQLIIDRGAGAYVYDQHGKQYLEGMAGLWCTALGYGNEELITATSEQMRKLSFSHMFGGKSHHVGMQLADKLKSIVPVQDAMVFFGSSGSDANDTHVKLLHYYFDAIGKPEKKKIIARDRAYHGVTVAAAALTGLPPMHTHFGLPFNELGVLRTDAPHYYRQGLEGESEEEFASRLANNLEQLIVEENPETIAAFIAEPVNGAGGVVVPPATYWEKIQALLEKYDIFLIADEVITGFGRTGKAWGSDTFGIQPTAMTLAKAMSSAYIPISAAIISGDMYQAMVEPSAQVGVFGHGYTYSGHPVACAVALKTIEIYERDKMYQHAAKTGEYLQTRLQEFAGHPLVGEVRGVGMIAALELVANKASKQPFDGAAIGAYAQQRCQENGLILRAMAGNNLALCPPLIIDAAQVDEIIEKVGKSLDETLDYAQREKLLA